MSSRGWALVAGASEGLGAAFSRALAKQGHDLVLVARRAGPLEELAEDLRRVHGVEVRTHALDLADAVAVAGLIEAVDPLEPETIVCNAAAAPHGELVDHAAADWLAAVDVNVRAPVQLLHGLLPGMARRGRGSVVIMSSLSCFQGVPRLALYTATKSFLLILGEALWAELKPKGVDVVVSTAGAIRTPSYLEYGGGKEVPGTMDPDEVVAATLAAIGRGPTVVPGAVNWLTHLLVGRLLPRRLAIGLMDKVTRELR